MIPYNGSAQSSMLPRRRTVSPLPQCQNFSSFVLGNVVVIDTQQRIRTIFYASTVQVPFHTSTV